MNRITRVFSILIFATMISAAFASAQEAKPPEPSKTDKCPVCGMFVYRYPDWVASVTFKNGPTFFFDGVKDMFKYLFDLAKYNPQVSKDDIETIFVTEYYDMKKIDGRGAFYVMGSDVYGPMGKELIPFSGMDDAEQFTNDHKATRILKWDEITPAIIGRLD